MDTCCLHSMLHVNFDLKKDFIEIWISFDFNKILSKFYFFWVGNSSFRLIDKLAIRLIKIKMVISGSHKLLGVL